MLLHNSKTSKRMVSQSKWIAVPALAISLMLAIISVGCARTPQQKQAKFLERGKKLLAAKTYDRAALEFRNAIQVDPREAEAYYQLAMADLGMRDFRGA